MKVVKLEDCINEIKSLDNNGFVTRSVNHICEDMRKEVKEFNAIPLDRIKQAREEIQRYEADCLLLEDRPICLECNETMFKSIYHILDKLIAESEEVNV